MHERGDVATAAPETQSKGAIPPRFRRLPSAAVTRLHHFPCGGEPGRLWLVLVKPLAEEDLPAEHLGLPAVAAPLCRNGRVVGTVRAAMSTRIGSRIGIGWEWVRLKLEAAGI